MKLEVASGGTRHYVERTLNIIGVAEYVNAVVTAQDFQLGKPAPGIFLKTAELFEVEPRNCLVFEDAALGIQAANTAGMKAVYVETHPYAKSAG